MSSFKNVLIVLGCAPRPDGRPSDAMVSRIRKAIQLYKKENYSNVILSGGRSRLPIPEADMMRIMLLHYIPENKIILERNSKTTVQNAVFCWEFLKNKDPKHITVVTSAYHIPRTRYIFRKLYRHMGSRLVFEPAANTFDPIELAYFTIKEFFATLKLRIFGIQ
jgi:uncharacterized SAM-binding protein YcdF (DUF218 family)